MSQTNDLDRIDLALSDRPLPKESQEELASVMEREHQKVLILVLQKLNESLRRPRLPIHDATLSDLDVDPDGKDPPRDGMIAIHDDGTGARPWIRIDGEWRSVLGSVVGNDVVNDSGVPGLPGTTAQADKVSGALLYLNELIAAVATQSIDGDDWDPVGTDLGLLNGGTGASTASGARTNLGLAYASTAEMEAGTATDRVVAPGTQHRHPSAAKCWGNATVSGGTPTLQSSFNVTSITDTDVGVLSVTIATDFSSANYSVVTGAARTSPPNYRFTHVGAAAGVFDIYSAGANYSGAPALADPSAYRWACFGDQ